MATSQCFPPLFSPASISPLPPPNSLKSLHSSISSFVSVSRIRKTCSCLCAFLPILASGCNTHSSILHDRLFFSITSQLKCYQRAILDFNIPIPHLQVITHSISLQHLWVWNSLFIFLQVYHLALHWNASSLRDTVHSSLLHQNILSFSFIISFQIHDTPMREDHYCHCMKSKKLRLREFK